MKNSALMTAALYCSAIIASAVGGGTNAQAESPIDPCLNCHAKETPKVVEQWEAGKHSMTGVKCYVCHHAEEGNKEGTEHNDFFVVTKVSVQTCESCHPENGADLLSKFTKDTTMHP